ncbi:MAG: hypothetical protein GXP35_14905 [Actinobacteria bacterium]|nr:hypothetical protein [Actinomycetota bacterium]
MTNKRHLLPRSAQLTLVASLAAAVASMFVAPPANSEESAYESIVDGELGFSASALAPGADVTVFADVFGALASVEFELTNADTGAVLMREQLTTDADGGIEHSFKLPSEMVTAEYRTEISGLTEDGALISLEKRFDIIGNVTELQTTTVATTAPPVEAGDEPTGTPDGVDPAPTSDSAVSDGAERVSDAAPGDAIGEVAADDFGDTQDTDPASSQQASSAANTNGAESTSAVIWIVTAAIVAGLGAIAVMLRRKSSPA